MPLKHSTSLKEFSTTPSVSKMLMKDGNNAAVGGENPNSTEGSNNTGDTLKAPSTQPIRKTKKAAAKEEEDMFTMD